MKGIEQKLKAMRVIQIRLSYALAKRMARNHPGKIVRHEIDEQVEAIWFL